MRITNTFHGFVQDDGKVDFEDPQDFLDYVRSLKGKRIDITVEVHRDRRSLDQNALLHVICKKIADDGPGYEEEEVWEMMKHKFLLAEKDGHEYCRSTTTLNTKEASDLIDRVIRWAAIDFGVVIESRREEAERRAYESEEVSQ